VTDTKRQQIKAKVAKGEARNRERSLSERAIEARDSAVVFAKENPLLLIVGGVAFGVAVSLLFRRSPTRKVAEQGARKASGLAWVAAQFALPLIQQAIAGASEAGRSGLGHLEEFGETAGGKARGLGSKAAGRASETLGVAKDAGKRIAKAVRSRAH
jgi:hypothetical protein